MTTRHTPVPEPPKVGDLTAAVWSARADQQRAETTGDPDAIARARAAVDAAEAALFDRVFG